MGERKAGLTNKEREVLLLISEGLTVKEIAKKLGNSPHTIDTVKAKILFKYDARNTAQLLVKTFKVWHNNEEG